MKKTVFIAVFATAALFAGSFTAAPVEAFEAADTLPDRIVEPEPNGPVLDTALVFTNLSGRAAEAKFQAYDDQGEPISSGHIDIPANGLVYVLASRMANAAGIEGFVGHVEAKATGHVIGSTVVLGGVLTDIDTINSVRRTRRRPDADAGAVAPSDPVVTVISRMTFPVVATR